MARTPAYTTAYKVSNQLQRKDFFSDSTHPSLDEVNELIMRAEDQIEEETYTAWRAVTVSDEYHDYLGVVGKPLFTRLGHRIPGEAFVRAEHRPLQSFVSGTHKIELWDGSSWKDLILTANGYTEGRGEDYYIDYNLGLIYLINPRPMIGDNVIRLTYAYGYASVPKTIEEAATKLAAIEVLMTQDRTMTVAEGGGSAPQPAWKIERWEKRIEDILARHREITSFHR